MLKFIYTEDGGRDIEMTYNDYPSFEIMCSMFRDLVAARGYDTTELAYDFAGEAFKDISIDTLCEEWRKEVVNKVQEADTHDTDLVIEATIDALVVSDKYYVRRLKDD